jgi:hypothetical protein
MWEILSETRKATRDGKIVENLFTELSPLTWSGVGLEKEELSIIKMGTRATSEGAI